MTTPPPPRATLEVGDSGVFVKTISELDVFKFADVSGDHNPLHIDEEYASHTIFGRRIAHGILTAGIISTVLGQEIPGTGTIFVDLHIRFLRPAYIGDTVTAKAMVTEIVNPKRVRLMVACTDSQGRDLAIGNALVVPPASTRLITSHPATATA
jgi:3-hydroxybutyryl-CoA dehydratase